MKESTPKCLTNIKTGEEICLPTPTDVCKAYHGETMITETDKDGIITYANRRFKEFSGYSGKELIGAPHAIVRHPDMPKGLFKAMWEIIQNKKIWRGYIKSLCKDGSYYWALVYIQPKINEAGEIVGYVANRRDAYPDAIAEVEERYALLQGKEHEDDPFFYRYELYHGEDMATFEGR